jgi:hypothetical protein
LVSWLELCRENSPGSARIRCSNIAWRICCTARLAAQVSPYCATKPATPRTANSPTITSGITHSGRPWPAKPLSSKGCIKAGISGSVAAPTNAASPAAAMAAFPLRK